MRDSAFVTFILLRLQVQPGQTKTVAYKQVSYHYNKDLDGKDFGKPGEEKIHVFINK